MSLKYEDFVKEYVKYEVLVNPKSPHYNNEEMRAKAIELLRKDLKIGSVNVVKAKILTIQTFYSNELVKQETSGQRSTLSWFNILDSAIKNPILIKEKGKWTENELRDLIQLVVKKPRLWNKKFLNQEKEIENGFNQIAQKLLKETEAVIENWNSLFSIYQEEKEKLSSSNGKYKSNWFAFESLSFLDINDFIKKYSVQSICRSCYWQNLEVCLDGFTTKINDNTILCDVFFNLTGIKLAEEDQFPVNFCENCLLNLTEFCNFKNKSLSTEEELQNLYEMNKAEIEIKQYLSTESTKEKYSPKNSVEIIEEMEVENKYILELVGSEEEHDYIEEMIIEDDPKTSNLDSENINEEYDFLIIKTEIEEQTIASAEENTIKEKKEYQCKLCPKSFQQVKKLKAHLVKHEGRFLCHTCGRDFARKEHLIGHSRTHSDERPFICKVCGFAFKQPGTLKDHMTIHTGKQFACTDCNKVFYRKLELKRHQMVHTGERPVGCDICGTRYTRASQLNVHIKVHHQGFRFTCEVCAKEFRTRAQLNRHLKSSHDIVKKKPYEPN